MTEKEYGKLVKDLSPKSPIWKDCLNAFWIGGLICTIGQAIMNGYLAAGPFRGECGYGYVHDPGCALRTADGPEPL